MGGEVYVTVEADASTPMLMDAGGSPGGGEAGGGATGGGGQTSMGVIIKWEYEGGITGSIKHVGWVLNGQTIEHEGKSVEEINASVANAAKGMGFWTLMSTIGDCAVMV